VASTIEKIKQLREETAAGMMDVKRALEESGGDVEGARKVLRERGPGDSGQEELPGRDGGPDRSLRHFNGRVGVLIEVNCETDFVARTPEFKEFARNVALHVASMRPMCVSPDDIPAGALQEERQVVEKQVAEMGKPENISAQIIEGRMKKWVSEQALLTQPYVKDTDKTVGDLLQDTIQRVGENVVIRRFVHYEL
jgi:elongation factor Ts